MAPTLSTLNNELALTRRRGGSSGGGGGDVGHLDDGTAKIVLGVFLAAILASFILGPIFRCWFLKRRGREVTFKSFFGCPEKGCPCWFCLPCLAH